MPDWYYVGRAARYWHMSPMELMARGDADIWINRALIAELAEL